MKRISFGLALLILIAGVGAASAQTMSYAEAISQIATVCKNDIARYCKGVPLGPRLRACFDAHAARMSPQCQQTTGVVYASITRRATAQRDIGDVCSADILRLCGTSFADANLVTCMAGLAPRADEPALLPDLRRYRLGYEKGHGHEAAPRFHRRRADLRRRSDRRSGATIGQFIADGYQPGQRQRQ